MKSVRKTKKNAKMTDRELWKCMDTTSYCKMALLIGLVDFEMEICSFL
jgi:hypothetical protein